MFDFGLEFWSFEISVFFDGSYEKSVVRDGMGCGYGGWEKLIV